LTAGPTPANPVALLSSKRLESALADLQTHADFVLCDAPPVLAVTDAALWAAKVDGVLLLVNAGNTKRDQAVRARSILEKVHARVIGAVLLNVEKDAAMSGW
jgi:non-specific protein-tyrosine kinase